MPMFTFEALPAKHGDALLLHFGNQQLCVIDGGPPGVYADALKPRLEMLRKERKLAPEVPLEIDLMMVSHIDEDHISGLLEFAHRMKDADDSHQPQRWRVQRFWHNAFDDTVASGGAGGAAAAGAADVSAASLDVFAASETLGPASVRQGRDMAKLLPALGRGGNRPFKDLVMRGKRDAVGIGPLKLTVIGPNEKNVGKLREEWAKKAVPILKEEKAKAEVAAFIDRSPYNLSSIVMLAESDNKRILLTGDGRGDHTLDELEQSGLLVDGKLDVDILKLPHHGSVRNVAPKYFDTIRARHYVISADGRNRNPDITTLEQLSASRPDDGFTIHFTYAFDDFTVPEIGNHVREFFEAEKGRGRKYEVRTRAKGETSITIAL